MAAVLKTAMSASSSRVRIPCPPRAALGRCNGALFGCAPSRHNGAVTELLDYCAGLPVRSVPAGGVLIEEGTRHDDMLVLVSGSVSVERDGVAFARIDSPGAVFGEMSVILDKVATATVRARSDVEVYAIAEPLSFLRERPGAALAVLRVTAARLDGLTQYLVDVKQQYADRDDHLGMVDGILDALVHHHPKPPPPGSARDPEAS
jgi:CRP/FNR family cyclic AMP-dependent transcriptional regulator